MNFLFLNSMCKNSSISGRESGKEEGEICGEGGGL